MPRLIAPLPILRVLRNGFQFVLQLDLDVMQRPREQTGLCHPNLLLRLLPCPQIPNPRDLRHFAGIERFGSHIPSSMEETAYKQKQNNEADEQLPEISECNFKYARRPLLFLVFLGFRGGSWRGRRRNCSSAHNDLFYALRAYGEIGGFS